MKRFYHNSGISPLNSRLRNFCFLCLMVKIGGKRFASILTQRLTMFGIHWTQAKCGAITLSAHASFSAPQTFLRKTIECFFRLWLTCRIWPSFWLHSTSKKKLQPTSRASTKTSKSLSVHAIRWPGSTRQQKQWRRPEGNSTDTAYSVFAMGQGILNTSYVIMFGSAFWGYAPFSCNWLLLYFWVRTFFEKGSGICKYSFILIMQHF